MREHKVAMDTTSRQRLRPWLEAKINSNTIPGLHWLDKSQQIFRVPWKHGGKHDWHEEDSLIFKEWAVHTGRFREGVDTPDWPTWKTRFRCALNKLPDITEVKELSSLDGIEPYRAYRFKPRHESRNNQGYQPPVSEMDLDQTVELKEGDKIMNNIEDFPPLFLNDEDTEMDISQYGISQQLMPNIPVQPQVVTPVVEREIGPVSPPTGELVPLPSSEPQGHEMFVKAMYRHIDVDQFTCSNVKGCRLYYGQDVDFGSTGLQESVFGPDGVENHRFPYCEEILKNQKQVSLTNHLLKALDRGIILECVNGSIFATRKCKCVIFVSSPSIKTKDPIRLQRDVRTNIYDYQQYFEPELYKYMSGRCNKPTPEILIGFGQNWKSTDQPLNNLLIAAMVSSSRAMHKLSQISFSSPISLPLELSRSDDFDKYLKHVRHVEENAY